jgi:hypothetical protein
VNTREDGYFEVNKAETYGINAEYSETGEAG